MHAARTLRVLQLLEQLLIVRLHHLEKALQRSHIGLVPLSYSSGTFLAILQTYLFLELVAHERLMSPAPPLLHREEGRPLLLGGLGIIIITVPCGRPETGSYTVTI